MPLSHHLYLNGLFAAACVSLLAAVLTAGFAASHRTRGDFYFRVPLLFALASLASAIYLGATYSVRLGFYLGELDRIPFAYSLALASAVLVAPAYMLLHQYFDRSFRRHRLRNRVLLGLCGVLALASFIHHPWSILASDTLRISGNNVLGDYGRAMPVYFAVVGITLLLLAYHVFRIALRARQRARWIAHAVGGLAIVVAPAIDILRELDVTLAPTPVAWLGFILFNATSFILLLGVYERLVYKLRSRTDHIERLNQALSRDPLTGLYSKSYLEAAVRARLRAGIHEEAPIGLLVLDIDDFKHINDRRGHYRGDQVLREVGEVLRGGLRERDIPCRWGGDEFVILLAEAHPDEALRVMTRLQKTIEDGVSGADPESFRLTASMGFAAAPPYQSWESLFEAADAALYRSKAQGKQRFTLAPTDQSASRELYPGAGEAGI